MVTATTSAAASSSCPRTGSSDPGSSSRRTLEGPASQVGLDSGPELLQRLGWAVEQPLRVLRVLLHRLINRIALVQVQPEAGQELQLEVLVGVDLRIAQPVFHVALAAAIRREQLDGRVDT